MHNRIGAAAAVADQPGLFHAEIAEADGAGKLAHY